MAQFSCELDAERRAQEIYDDLKDFIQHNPNVSVMNIDVLKSCVDRVDELLNSSLEYLNHSSRKGRY